MKLAILEINKEKKKKKMIMGIMMVENLKFLGSTPDLKLDSLDIHVLDDKLDLQTKSLLSDVETLK